MGKKILLIDDEADFCKITKMNLELISDFSVEFATNAKAGINLAKRIKPDLILLDIRMPGMDGLVTLEKLKSDKDTMEIPVVMLTALDSEDYKLKASSLYDEDYITKPIEAKELKAKIEEVLSRRRII